MERFRAEGRRESKMLSTGQQHRRFSVYHVKVRRKLRSGDEVEEELALDNEEEENELSPSSKKKKRKDVWLGESFDIGREFLTARKTANSGSEAEAISGGAAPGLAEGSTPKRPPNSSRTTTQESFVTAREDFSSVGGSRDHLPDIEANEDLRRGSSASEASIPPHGHRNSYTSSMRPLVSEIGVQPKGKTQTESLQETRTLPFRSRLKSAIRKPSVSSDANATIKAKTVQFPMNLESRGDNLEEPRKGNSAPADPSEVLDREGDEIAGTSYAAAEEALEDEDEDEVYRPGDVILRGERELDLAKSRPHAGSSGPS